MRPPTRRLYGRQRPSLWVSNVQRWKLGTNPYEPRLGRSPTQRLTRLLQRHWPIERSTWRRSSASEHSDSDDDTAHPARVGSQPTEMPTQPPNEQQRPSVRPPVRPPVRPTPRRVKAYPEPAANVDEWLTTLRTQQDQNAQIQGKINSMLNPIKLSPQPLWGSWIGVMSEEFHPSLLPNFYPVWLVQPIARKSSATTTITRRSSSADDVDWATDTPAPTSGRPASTPVNLSLPSLSDISFSGLTSLLQESDETTNHWFVYLWTLWTVA